MWRNVKTTVCDLQLYVVTGEYLRGNLPFSRLDHLDAYYTLFHKRLFVTDENMSLGGKKDLDRPNQRLNCQKNHSRLVWI